MTKVYILDQEKNNATFIIYGEGGNMVRYTFKDGNTAIHQKATCMLQNEYYQNLLEGDEIFKKGIVKLDPTYKVVAPKAETKSNYTALPEIKTVTQAVEYCAENFGEVVKTAIQAKKCAQNNGFDFVNLKTKE